MKKRLTNIFFAFTLLLCCSKVGAQEEREPLFVSLGSTCQVTSYFRQAGITGSFPFDKLLTPDGNGLVSLLRNDFAGFLDQRSLHQDKQFISINYRVINKRYNIDFRYDWHDLDDSFEEDLPKIQEKYQKRIDNFRQLANYTGKVYFVRSAYPTGYPLNPNFYLPKLTNDSDIIFSSQAKKLKEVLCQKFPNLDFELIILNFAELRSPNITGLDKVIEYKIKGSQATQDFLQLYENLKKRNFSKSHGDKTSQAKAYATMCLLVP